VFGFFFNYGITKHNAGTQLQWQLPTALQLIPAFIWGAGILFVAESPRWLLSVNRRTEAIHNLIRIRNLSADHPLVAAELSSIELQLQHESDIVANASQWSLLKETFAVVENRRRFWLMLGAHTFGQWSGANAITQYSPTIFGYVSLFLSTWQLLTFPARYRWRRVQISGNWHLRRCQIRVSYAILRVRYRFYRSKKIPHDRNLPSSCHSGLYRRLPRCHERNVCVLHQKSCRNRKRIHRGYSGNISSCCGMVDWLVQRALSD